MKKKVYTALVMLFLVIQGIAQTNYPNIGSKEYDQMKKDGTLPKDYFTNYKFPQQNNNTPKPHNILEDIAKQKSGNNHPNKSPLPPPPNYCTCLQTIDASYSVAPICQGACAPPDYRQDDGTTQTSIPLPFTFCFYGNNYNSVFINNNGNITFDASYTPFTATGFPAGTIINPATNLFSGPIMIAPFWADVDTRDLASGLVYYKVTPTYMVVQWKDVGYFPMMSDKLNTFQVIISNGSDPILQPGMNVGFCYGDMQWTTGSASSGVNGFGGVAANVGANRGNGIDYFQMGRFDQPAAAYDGPYGNNDGIDWLDGKSFYADVCNGTNIAPMVTGFNSCDTIHACGVGDTSLIHGNFLSPESGQFTTVTINLNGTQGATIINNTNGNTATASVMIVASPLNAGMNIITFTATDNGVPAQTTVVNVQVFVDLLAIPPQPILSGNQAFCVGDSIQLTVSPSTFDSYQWSTGSNTNTSWIHDAGQYWVISTLNGCPQTDFVTVVENPLPTPVITGPIITACGTGTTTLTCDSLIYASYLWSNGSPTSSITVGGGTYTLTVVDTNGCTDTSPPVTVTSQPAPTILAHNDTSFCNGSANLWVTFPGPALPTSCGLSTSGACGGFSTAAVVGTGAQSCSNYSYPAPFGNEYTSTIQQYLYTPAELAAAGISAGKIDQLDFNVTLIDMTSWNIPITTYHNYEIKMGCTNLTTFSSFPTSLVSTGLYTVFPSATHTVTTGWNTFPFATAYEWDGVSNLIVQICFSEYVSGSNYTINCQTAQTPTTNYSSQEYVSDQQDVCPNQNNGFYEAQQMHPDIKFHYCVAPVPANFNYQWTAIPASATIANASAQITTGTPVVPTQFAVVVTNVNGGCSATDTVSVGVINISTMHIDSIAPVCTASPIDTLVISVPIGTGVFSGSGITDTTLGVFDPSQAAIGLDTIRYTVTGNICGSGTTYILVQVDNTLNPTITPVAPLCTSYSPITLHAATAGGSWSGYGITDTLLGTFDPSLPGLVGYDSITYTIYHPCYSRDTVLIHVTQQLNATINPTAGPYCIGVAPFSFSSNGTGGVDTWAGPGMSANGLFNPYLAGPGTHTITHYLSAFCGDTATATVTVLANPTSTISSDRVDGCEPTVIHFTSNNNTPGGSCFWDFGDGHTSTNTDPTNTYTSYNGGVPYNVTMIYTDLNQCKDTVNTPAMITIFSQPHASFSVTPQPTDITQPEIHFLDASTGVIDTWAWTFGDGQGSALQNPTYSYADTGRYQIVLTVSNLHNCIDTAHGEVVIDPILTCYIPNAFTPGDENGRNDEFRIMGTNILAENFQMQIFDRWGERVFYSQDFNQGWNGRKSNVGGILEMGVYVYKINLKDWKGLEHEYIGHITMIK